MIAREVLYHLSFPASSFFGLGIVEMGSPELFAGSWLQISILMISASGVARITGISNRHPDLG
jgi:hypothetical protein